MLGSVPYDFRVPTFERFRDAYWDPDTDRVFTDKVIGVGWAVNIPAGQSLTASSTDVGGIAFDPLSGACSAVGCDTFVAADIPDLVRPTTATRTVRVIP